MVTLVPFPSHMEVLNTINVPQLQIMEYYGVLQLLDGEIVLNLVQVMYLGR